MPDVKPTTVLWPDLARFGLELTVAHNPSLGRNLLRLAVLDRDRLASDSGLVPEKHGDFFRIMRDVGFAYVPSEIQARRMAAYWDAEHRGASPEEQGSAVEREVARLYFYSPSLSVSKDMLKRIVPALNDGDFRQMSVSEIKHFDFRYLDDRQAEALFGSQQAFTGAEPGVFYTTPGDRELMQRLAQRRVSIDQLLRLGGGATDTVGVDLSEADLASLSVLHPVPGVQQLVSAQALLADGSALRTIAPSATLLGYPCESDAIEANGGRAEGVERVHVPEGLPVAFGYPARRVLVVKDGRFLEFGSSPRRDAKTLSAMSGVQFHWNFLDRVVAISREAEAATAAGLFDDSALDGPGIEAASAEAEKLRAMMRSAVEDLPVYGTQDFLTTSSVLMHSGIRHSMLREVCGPELSIFLAEFPALCARIEQKQAARNADDVLAAGVRAALSKVESADVEQASGRREDAGEKIGGARKDYARRWLAQDELDGMTARERAEVVTKENVWPALDYAAMEDQGVAPEIAYCIRELRNALPTTPYRGGFNIKRRSLQYRASKDLTLAQCSDFVRAVSLVRDALAGVRTYDDLLNAVVKIRQTSDTGRYVWQDQHWFFDGAGYQFAVKVLPGLNDARKGDLDAASWEFTRFVHVAKAKTDGGWVWAGKKPRTKAVDAEANRERPEPEVPHLDHIERIGVDYRHGRDVDEQLLLDVFGFRGVEYGNWLPQAERQIVLNHSFDAFMDLAAALKLPPKAMSLGGDLALAFGARGKGGKRAACAHYEPARNVINLTRLSGAGALAHEWGHALDYFLAKSCDVSQVHALTTRPEKERRTAPPIAEAFVAIVDEATKRYRTKDEVINDLVMMKTAAGDLSMIELVRSRLEDHINNLDRLLPEEMRGTVFREFAAREAEKMLVPVDNDPRLVRMLGIEDFERNLATALDLQVGREWRDRVHSDTLKYASRVAAWAKDRCANVDLVQRQYEPRHYPAPSRFLTDGEYFDSFRSKPYWSTRVELFARAFESWVQDQVQREPGQRSQYLVFGRDERPDAEHSGYPRGEERARIASVFGKFFDEHRPELLRRLGLIQPEADLIAA